MDFDLSEDVRLSMFTAGDTVELEGDNYGSLVSQNQTNIRNN
ncbi:MAG: hypothetical protein ACP5P0_06585 [Hydrogenobacter sp.]